MIGQGACLHGALADHRIRHMAYDGLGA